MQSRFCSIRSSLTGLVAFTLTANSSLSSVLSTLSLALFLSANPGVMSDAMAQSSNSTIDGNPPVIELEVIPRGIAGQEQVFTSLVSDDSQVQDVFLYFRFNGQRAYNSILMESIGGSSYYIATVSPEENDTRDIEYYIQARDVAGNRTVEGFAFEPIVRQLRTAPVNQTDQTTAGSSTTTTSGSETPPPSSSGGFKLWHLAVGIALLGLVAGAAGGGSGGGGGGNGQTVPLTITVNSP